MSLIKPFIEGETIILEEEQSETIALMPGAFKPPHRDHLRRINAAAENSDKAIILISPLDRVKEGETPISAKQSLAIWQLYKDKEVPAAVGSGSIEAGVASLTRYVGDIPAVDIFYQPFFRKPAKSMQTSYSPPSHTKFLVLFQLFI